MKRISVYILGVLLCSSGGAWADMLIIAHQNTSETTISQKEIQEIFLGKRVQWKDNTAIHPATLKEPKLHETFLKQYVKKTPSQWIAHWKRMVFTGSGAPPQQFATKEELLEYVANTSGAIGYVDAATSIENVTILKIQ
ncbi:MAG: substrate-binding domain-containing protein [Candidatus Vecturithrix sp.]|jgi:ABC-type phosphate transport system substrate-binding protein|nr:substrate-binding domain-containing protein [Candidatus Vecturithrix sp.]